MADLDLQDIRLLARLESKVDSLTASFQEFKEVGFHEFKQDTRERIDDTRGRIDKVERDTDKRVGAVEKAQGRTNKKVYMIMGGIATLQFVILLAARLVH